MDDLISRQAAIDCLTATKLKKFDFILQAREEIKNLPSASTEKTRWIPVSERLPDIHNYCMKYLVTDFHGHIHTSLFTESRGESWWSHEDVIAWMPLPPSYDPQESEVDG